MVLWQMRSNWTSKDDKKGDDIYCSSSKISLFQIEKYLRIWKKYNHPAFQLGEHTFHSPCDPSVVFETSSSSTEALLSMSRNLETSAVFFSTTLSLQPAQTKVMNYKLLFNQITKRSTIAYINYNNNNSHESFEEILTS